jgi:ribonuclease HI
LAEYRVQTRDEAVDSFEAWLLAPAQYDLLQRVRTELRGKDLVCWCAPQRCHGEVLMKYANGDLDVSDGVALFTDGSSWTGDGIGGWAWVALDAHGGEVHQNGWVVDTTNNRMEMEAWIEGLDYLHYAYGPCEVLVYSDSEYVGLGAFDKRRARRNNTDLWAELDQALALHEYTEFCYVRGHEESYYNNMADELAGEARRTGQELNKHEHNVSTRTL